MCIIHGGYVYAITMVAVNIHLELEKVECVPLMVKRNVHASTMVVLNNHKEQVECVSLIRKSR